MVTMNGISSSRTIQSRQRSSSRQAANTPCRSVAARQTCGASGSSADCSRVGVPRFLGGHERASSEAHHSPPLCRLFSAGQRVGALGVFAEVFSALARQFGRLPTPQQRSHHTLPIAPEALGTRGRRCRIPASLSPPCARSPETFGGDGGRPLHNTRLLIGQLTLLAAGPRARPASTLNTIPARGIPVGTFALGTYPRSLLGLWHPLVATAFAPIPHDRNWHLVHDLTSLPTRFPLKYILIQLPLSRVAIPLAIAYYIRKLRREIETRPNG